MKISTVFIVSFITLTSANNSYQQCGMEQTKINQLEMQIQQLKDTNQALAASGGMSAVNMLVGFLSGYAGSHSNNNKCCSDLDEVKEAVRALQESNAQLAAKVEILEEQMSNVTSAETITTAETASAAETTNVAETTTAAKTTAAAVTTAREQCNDDEFQCLDDSSCVPKAAVCNFVSDCSDKSDEADCCYHEPFTFRCLSDSSCVPIGYQCDGEEDCPDGSDELNCGSSEDSEEDEEEYDIGGLFDF